MDGKENKENLVNAGNLGNADSGLPAQDKEAAALADTLPDNYLVDDPTLDIEDDEENRRRFIITPRMIKLGTALVFSLMILIIASIAWFTMNRENETNGMSVKSVGDLFTIEPVNASAYHVGIYDDPDQSGTYVRDILTTHANIDGDVMTWTITDDEEVSDGSGTKIEKGNNIGNGPAPGQEGGIRPGSSGMIQFIIRPSQSVTAEFAFYVYTYTGGYDEHGDEDKSTIRLISAGTSTSSGTSAASLMAQQLMNGHFLLFTNVDDDGRYYGLIDSDEEFKRIMTKTYSTQTTVNLYWVWPETLAEIMLDETVPTQSRNMRGKRNICTADGKQEVITLFKNHPEWFLLDPVNTRRDWTDTFSPNELDEDVISTVNTSYSLYSSYYNEADQCIGTNISYILLDMTAGEAAENNQGSSSGTGSGS